jgi:ABC-type multidrug transport system ATPase subunit
MSEKILQALMQLFAIVANAERLTAQGRSIVTSFLTQQLSQSHVNKYLAVFDEYLSTLQGKADPTKVKKRVSVNSVKVLRICTDINSELDQKQKYIVLIRLIEFAYSSDEEISEQESEFLNIVSETFNISAQEYGDCLSVASGINDIRHYTPRFLVINGEKSESHRFEKHIYHEGFPGKLYVLYIRPAGILFTRYFGDSTLTLNGLPLLKNSCYVLTQGSVIRGPRVQGLYFSDIMQRFMESNLQQKLSFDVKHISYTFKNGRTGLHPIDFTVSSGNLIGIMGGSGTGKSTLLNVLNTNLTPGVGEVLINGHNIHHHSPELEGVIGYVPQDDLLMEDLTVFQNLFYSSKLCFGGLHDDDIRKKSEEVLASLGLLEIKDLEVGSVLEKTISGGQRKRLNIALELIREPAVLFVDEPTSGLSSRDSENVMDLLKQLAIGGKLIFVVIHQPSSDIFKMFDKLLILDLGGYPVYFGNPSDSLMYFKAHANYAEADDAECHTCGNINPEQVFSILESKVLDEFGNFTPQRKILPEEWNRFYIESKVNHDNEQQEDIPLKKQQNRKPSAFSQFTVFLTRDLLAKMRNRQYLWINLLEAPVLAFILAYFLRYKAGDTYVFRENMNLPAFIFMSVIVSLFIGLMVSAEEIIRDRKIRKREAFLNLSKMSYLLSKICILFSISAIQTALFLFVGSNILGIKDMFVDYWVVLFSVSCFANLLGLNISASFNEAVTIYILIPFLIIPQILMSGIMVKFHEMNPVVSCYDKVPLVGESMISRWAFEALAVNQYKNNAYEKQFFDFDKSVSHAYFKKDFWLIRLDDKLEEAKRNMVADTAIVASNLRLIRNELMNESISRSMPPPQEIMRISNFDQGQYSLIKKYLQELNQYYVKLYNTNTENKERKRLLLEKAGLSPDKMLLLKNTYDNESINDLLLNSNGSTSLREYNGGLLRTFQPVYMEGDKKSFIRAQFFVHNKFVFGTGYSTYRINIAVMWMMSLLLAVALYFEWLKKLLKLFTGSH